MTKIFHLIRHGESQSNAGEKTQHPLTIRLTNKGREEAKQAAVSFPAKPDLVVTSRYIRTKQTAEPLLERFKDVPQDEWNIHEFTYLSAEKYNGMTNAERQPFVEEYWRRADPFYKEDADTESFAEFAERCREAVEQIKDCKEECTAAFCHGYMINGILFHLAGGFKKIDSDTMRQFWDYHNQHKIANCQRFEFDIQDDRTVTLKKPPVKKFKKHMGPAFD